MPGKCRVSVAPISALTKTWADIVKRNTWKFPVQSVKVTNDPSSNQKQERNTKKENSRHAGTDAKNATRI